MASPKLGHPKISLHGPMNIYQCQHSKREIVILKLDFTKAFDTIEHNTIIQLMCHLGFPDIWLHWIQRILASGTSSILLIGVSFNLFQCRHGETRWPPVTIIICPCCWSASVYHQQRILRWFFSTPHTFLWAWPIPNYPICWWYPPCNESLSKRTLYSKRFAGILWPINRAEG